jgi:serine/threonine protein kinase
MGRLKDDCNGVEYASGAQFIVRQGDIGYFREPTYLYDAAIKSSKFMLDAQDRLNLSSESVRRQVSDLLIEVAALRHPHLRRHENIVDIMGWGVDHSWHGVPFIALELASKNLGDLIAANTSIAFENRRSMISGIASALSAIHDIGIVHGDLKPENILVFEEESRWIAKLSDFGGGAGLNGANALRGRGTTGWRAPELRRFHDYGEPLDPTLLSRIDIYSFGLLTWSMLCWSVGPLRRNEEESELDSASHDLQKRQDISEMLKTSYQNLLRACLHKQPQDRPSDIGALLPQDEQSADG